MGNRQPQKVELPKYQWTWAGNHNGLDLYQRQEDGLLAEKRLIVLDHRHTLEKEQEIYKLRENNNLGFVKVYQVDGVEEQTTQDKSNFCKCGESTKLNVYTERIEHRLSELPQATFQESLQMLWETTNSFQQIYDRFGPFHINGELIGINHEHKIKVWLNENFALNHPSHEIPYLKTMSNYDLPPELRNQHEMINNLLQVIEEKTEKGRFPQPFGEGAYHNSKSFHQLKKYLNSYMQNGDPRQISPQPYNPPPLQGQPPVQGQTIYHPVETTLPSNNNPIKQSFIQTSYHPIEQGDRVNSSHPPTYNYPQSTTQEKPTITFGNNAKPIDGAPLHFNHHSELPQHNYANPPQQQYTLPSQQTYAAPVIPSESLQGNKFPRFQMFNEPDSKPITGTVIPSYTTTNGSNVDNPGISGAVESREEPRPDLQLQRIKNMLRQDINSVSQKGELGTGDGNPRTI